jgi:hypothetical protein
LNVKSQNKQGAKKDLHFTIINACQSRILRFMKYTLTNDENLVTFLTSHFLTNNIYPARVVVYS